MSLKFERLRSFDARKWHAVCEPADWSEFFSNFEVQARGGRRQKSPEVRCSDLAAVAPEPYRQWTSPTGTPSIIVSDLPFPSRALDEILREFEQSARSSVESLMPLASELEAMRTRKPKRSRFEQVHPFQVRTASKDLIAIWHLRVITSPPPKYKSTQSIKDRAVLVRIELSSQWQVSGVDAQAYERAFGFAVEYLAREVMDELSSIAQACEPQIPEVLVRFELAAADNGPLTTAARGGLQRAAAGVEDDAGVSFLDDFPSCVLVGLRQVELTSEELRRGVEREDPKQVFHSGEPGAEFTLSQVQLAWFVTDDGTLVDEFGADPLVEFENYYGCSPWEMLSDIGVDIKYVRRLARMPGRKRIEELKRFDENESSFAVRFSTAVSFLVEADNASRTPVRLTAIRPQVLVLADVATNVSYAEVIVGRPDLNVFLDHATTDGPATLLRRVPERLRIPRNFLSANPVLSAWCASHGVAITHPTSGFMSGLTVARLWKKELEENYRNSDGFRLLASAAAACAWAQDHAYVMAANFVAPGAPESVAGSIRWRDHYTGVSSMDAERYFSRALHRSFEEALTSWGER